MAPRNLAQRRGTTSHYFRLPKLTLTPCLVIMNMLCLILIARVWWGQSTNNVDKSIGLLGMQSSAAADKNNLQGTPIIAYLVSMTDCGDNPFLEGAAVLKYSIHAASIHGHGRYDYKLYAIYHPDAKECAMSLKELGFELVERPTPVKVEEIQGETLRTKIEKNGCCGAKELIKLEAYTFTQYPIVVHMDMDAALLKPLDSLFDVMLDTSGANLTKKYANSLHLMWPDQPLPDQVNAFFTRDFAMVPPGRKVFPVQGGFLVLRPNKAVYQELIDTVKKGDFHTEKGWGSVTGLFYGCMTVQGLLPYYYDVLHRDQSVDLNHCVYNNMCAKPRLNSDSDPVNPGQCHTGQWECEDCRLRNVKDLVSIHFTNCYKPWHCMAYDKNTMKENCCRKLGREWFRIKMGLEKNWGRYNRMAKGKYLPEQFFGLCNRYGQKGFIPASRPLLPTFADVAS